MRDSIESFMIVLARFVINLIYRVCCILPRRDEIVFVSRQANDPSYDFLKLGKAYEEKDYRVVFLTKKLSKKTALAYSVHVIREIAHLAHCRMCFIDRYDPVICLINFTYEPVAYSLDESASEVYRDFPMEPVVVQLWHAFGAFKCFGFQSRDTAEGHTLDTMKRYGIHHNYSWVLCSGEGCRQAFAQAFNCPVERVIPLLRPVYDEILELRKKAVKYFSDEIFDVSDGSIVCAKGSDESKILFAPTLRKSSESPHPFRELEQSNNWRVLEQITRVEWMFHPLEERGLASGVVSDLLLHSTVVVTDYSSIAYEAFLLGKPVVFYVPDIDDYRVSPGLTADPLIICPSIAFVNEEKLLLFLTRIISGGEWYPCDALKKFTGSSIAECNGSALSQLVEMSFTWLNPGRSL